MLTHLRSLVAIVLLVAAASGIASAQNRSLRILLTNDDGYDSAGLKAMHAALQTAGHRVTVVAPATNMSASSMSMKVESKGEGI